MTDTQPIFIVGSGRSGTRSMFKMLSGIAGVEAHHEYACTHIQPLAAMYSMGIYQGRAPSMAFKNIHGAAIHYSSARLWVDCSNKLSWIIKPILDVFPTAKFILITRDGRKVASSYFHKLSDEMYDDRSVEILDGWLRDKDDLMPPPEKKYWWNIPQQGQPFHEEFPKFNRFERCCYHWRESNRIVLQAGGYYIPAGQYQHFKLEELAADIERVREMLRFMELPSSHAECLFSKLQRPEGVVEARDYLLTEEQSSSFYRIAGDMQKLLGYAGEEYRVKY